ncbi:DUF2892 domain-containing protein [Neobacillus sp. D3-1R]|uniref:DUF2892 domain-containing protein n=1 Tax=Neobacillus sp. D3-1R TaxID=3445778 RepID=UPI003FA0C3F4
MLLSKLFSPTTMKVNLHTEPEINEKIRRRIQSNIEAYKGRSDAEILSRMRELDYEWDTERTLETNFAVIVVITALLGLFGKKAWFLISAIAGFFMLRHAFQGWCPPLPIIRKCGIRTAAEIMEEKEGLKRLLTH